MKIIVWEWQPIRDFKKWTITAVKDYLIGLYLQILLQMSQLSSMLAFVLYYRMCCLRLGRTVRLGIARHSTRHEHVGRVAGSAFTLCETIATVLPKPLSNDGVFKAGGLSLCQWIECGVVCLLRNVNETMSPSTKKVPWHAVSSAYRVTAVAQN